MVDGQAARLVETPEHLDCKPSSENHIFARALPWLLESSSHPEHIWENRSKHFKNKSFGLKSRPNESTFVSTSHRPCTAGSMQADAKRRSSNREHARKDEHVGEASRTGAEKDMRDAQGWRNEDASLRTSQHERRRLDDWKHIDTV